MYVELEDVLRRRRERRSRRRVLLTARSNRREAEGGIDQASGNVLHGRVEVGALLRVRRRCLLLPLRVRVHGRALLTARLRA